MHVLALTGVHYAHGYSLRFSIPYFSLLRSSPNLCTLGSCPPLENLIISLNFCHPWSILLKSCVGLHCVDPLNWNHLSKSHLPCVGSGWGEGVCVWGCRFSQDLQSRSGSLWQKVVTDTELLTSSSLSLLSSTVMLFFVPDWPTETVYCGSPPTDNTRPLPLTSLPSAAPFQ